MSTDQEALPIHQSWAREVLSDRTRRALGMPSRSLIRTSKTKHMPSLSEPGRSSKQGLPLTEQEKRLSHYRKTAAEVRADWQKTLRRVGTIDGVEF